jgi:hypothetical protein
MIEEKFLNLVDATLSSARSHAIIDACWRAEGLVDAVEIAANSVPSRQPR